MWRAADLTVLAAGWRPEGLTWAEFSPGGRWAAAADAAGGLSFWEARPPHLGEIRVLPAHAEAIPQVGFSPCGRYVATASEDGTLRLWSDR